MRVAESAAERVFSALVGARGFRVRLRVALPASVGDDGEQMGLAAAGFEDREIGRGVFRKAGSSRVLLVGAGAGEALQAEALGVVIGTQLYAIEGYEALRAVDDIYGYALTLAAASGGAHP